MLDLIRFLLWTACAVALGIWMGTAKLGGKTPWERVQSLVVAERTEERVTQVKTRVQEALEDAKDALAPDARTRPGERHSDQDRAEVNKLLASRSRK